MLVLGELRSRSSRGCESGRNPAVVQHPGVELKQREAVLERLELPRGAAGARRRAGQRCLA